jgi:hypothetical protein
MLTHQLVRYKRRVPDLDRWLTDPAICVRHSRESNASADDLWAAASRVRIADVGLLGRLIRWRIPGTPARITLDELFRRPPFLVLEDDRDRALVSGLVGRIWTLRRDYPKLSDPEEFVSWSVRGTSRVVFANWVEEGDGGRTRLLSEARVEAFGVQGRLGLAAVRPLVGRFHNRIGADGLAAAVRRAEQGR